MNKEVHFSGLIIKHENLVPILLKNLDNVCICEASNPYANYYGQLPNSANPNSIFLFTKQFYYLEEIISYSKKVEKCLLEKINIASSVIEQGDREYNAIRIKNFPDYEQLEHLYSCLAGQGIQFLKKLPIEGTVKSRINKLFVLDEIEEGFYLDLVEENKGYYTHPNRVSDEDFTKIMTQIKHNGNCHLFDAVRGEIIVDGQILEIVRIFSEGLKIEQLKCIKKEFDKLRR